MFDVDDCTKRPVFARWDEPDRMHGLSGASPQRYYVRRPYRHYPGEVRDPTDPNRYRPKPPKRRPYKYVTPAKRYKVPAPRRRITPLHRPATVPPRAVPLTRIGRRMFRRMMPGAINLALLLMDLQIVQPAKEPGYNFEGLGFAHLWGQPTNCGFSPQGVHELNGCLPDQNVYECLAGQALSGHLGNYGDPVTVTKGSLVIVSYNQFGRARLHEHYCRGTVGDPTVVPFDPAKPQRVAAPDEPYVPWRRIAPRWLPIQWPTLPPLPLPWVMIPEVMPDPYEPDADPVPYPVNKPAQSPLIPGNRVPAFEIVIEPGRPPRVTGARTSRHVRRPPIRRKERESKKVIGINSTSMLGKMIGAATESLDFLNAMWDALPWYIRREHRGLNPIEKLAVILQNLEHFEPGSFVAAWLSNNLQDAALGRIGRMSARASRSAFQNLRGSVGLQSGPWDTPEGPLVPEGGQWTDALDAWLGENVYNPSFGNTSWIERF